MSNNNLTEAEQLLLNKMNLRVMKILRIEELLKGLKVPMDKDYLYASEDEQLDNVLEMLENAIKNRSKYLETNEEN